jgi:hypothetical protein
MIDCMSPDQSTMERLVFIKSLHQEGVEQSQRPMPMASMSVLTFHDAVELFLYLSAEEVDAHTSDKLMDYWNDIKQKSGIELFGKAGINRLRQARAGLKHYGNRPDEREIESFRSTVQTFFEENTPKIFDVKYRSVSLAHLIKFEDAKEHILKADEMKSKDKLAEAMGELKLAHEKLMSEYDERALFELEYSILPRFKGTGKPPGELEDRYSASGLDDINRGLEEISDALIYITNGIDYERYSRFNYLTPRLRHNQDSENRFDKYRPSLESYEISDIPEASYEYCMNFVIELALSLQNPDFDLDSKPPSESDSRSVLDF